MIFKRILASPHGSATSSSVDNSGARQLRRLSGASTSSVDSEDSDDSLTNLLIRGAQNVSQPQTPPKWKGDTLSRLSNQLAEAFAGMKLKPELDKQIAQLKFGLSESNVKESNLRAEFDELLQVTEALRVENEGLKLQLAHAFSQMMMKPDTQAENERLKPGLVHQGLKTQVVSKRNRLDAVAHELYK